MSGLDKLELKLFQHMAELDKKPQDCSGPIALCFRRTLEINEELVKLQQRVNLLEKERNFYREYAENSANASGNAGVAALLIAYKDFEEKEEG